MKKEDVMLDAAVIAESAILVFEINKQNPLINEFL